ncbi:hypothetical protein [Rhizobium sp. Rhizsp82]|uniref:hypothetical protein n=1 Tax=Rhizobium sp. Rhizsp82 TaxID=3243057 RepID=UPI0039B6CEA1
MITEIQSNNKSDFAASLKKLGGLALAGPGALSVVGEFSDKLDLSGLLTRIAANFRTVTNSLWHALEGWLHFRLPLAPASLTMFCLLVIPVFFQSASLKRHKEGELLITLSLIFTYLLTLYLHPALNNYTLIFISVFYLIAACLYSIFPNDTGKFDQLTRSLILFSVIIAAFQYFYGDPYTMLDRLLGGTPAIDPSVFASLDFVPIAAVILITVRRVSLGSPGPLYVALLATGLLAIDKFSTIVKPAIDGWLSSIGA